MQGENNNDSRKEKLEKLGSAVRAGANHLTGGAYDKLRRAPIVGNGVKKVENGAGKALGGSLDKLGGNRSQNLPRGPINNNIGNGNSSNPGNTNNDGGIPKEDGLNKDKESLKDKDDSNGLGKKKAGKKGFFNRKEKEENDVDGNTDASGDVLGNALKKIPKHVKISILGGVAYFFGVILIIVLVVAVISSIGEVATNFINGVKDFFTKDQQELEEEFYNELASVQAKKNSKDNICIDINLITATLTVDKDFGDLLDEGGETVSNPDTSNVTVDEDDLSGEVLDSGVEYNTKMKKQVALLANMQVKHNKYSLDKTENSYCRDTETIVPVDENNKKLFDRGLLWWLKDDSNIDTDSSSYEKIASNDRHGITSAKFTFFSSGVDDETNFSYYIYYPPYDSDGSCSKEYAKKKLKEKNENSEAELSIGDLSKMEESVYYWNLVNSFIPDYYDDYLPAEEPKRTEVIKNIAEDIYLLYEDLGPSQTCSSSSYYAGPSNLCPNGIIIDGIGTIDFEDYIAGVVSREAYTSEGMEALKAQAVAARTYALNYTNNCQKSISNSTNAQTYTRDVNDRARQAVSETNGEILTYNGETFSSQYDSFCYDDKDCPDSKKNADGSYSVTYTRVPSNETHKITLSDKAQYGRITHKQGHAHGMSQLLSYQLAKEGKNYKEILTYFYASGVEIYKSISASTTDGAVLARSPITSILSSNGTSVGDFNNYIFSQVKSGGVGTRNGVVAAAISLTDGLFSKTGYILPYELIPSGKYSGYGIDPTWGTNTSNATYPVNGLDCSGFVSWAIHNGGYKYDARSARDWGNASDKRSWSKGSVDANAKPGDLIYNAPASNNGTTGHIRMIVGVTDSGYVVAEAGSRNVGVRVTNVSFTSTGNYYLVDMTRYYNEHAKVSDYPG